MNCYAIHQYGRLDLLAGTCFHFFNFKCSQQEDFFRKAVGWQFLNWDSFFYYQRRFWMAIFFMANWRNDLVLGDVKSLSVLGCPYNGWNFTADNIWTVGVLTNGVNCPVANVLGRSPVLQNLFIVVHQLPQMHQIVSFHYKQIFLVEKIYLFFYYCWFFQFFLYL